MLSVFVNKNVYWFISKHVCQTYY